MDESNFELLLESVKEAGAILREDKKPARIFAVDLSDSKDSLMIGKTCNDQQLFRAVTTE